MKTEETRIQPARIRPKKARIDKLLVERGLADTRTKAQALIMSGSVFVGDRAVDKAGTEVKSDAEITVKGKLPFVSRGGLKLDGFLEKHSIDVEGLTIADVGSSTGGFTDCLLQRGAARIIAIDVGKGIIDWKLRSDERVTLIESCNIRHIDPETLPVKADLAVADLSFISIKKVLEKIKAILKPGSSIITLVKPQFEVGRENIGKGGIVRDDSARLASVADIKAFAETLDLTTIIEDESPIKGTKGNIEFFLYLRDESGK